MPPDEKREKNQEKHSKDGAYIRGNRNGLENRGTWHDLNTQSPFILMKNHQCDVSFRERHC